MSTEPTPPAEQAPDNGLGLVCAGGIFFASLWMAYLGVADYLLPAHRADYAYAHTTATVLAADVGAFPTGKGGEYYNPKVLLRYDAGGHAREEWARLDWSEPHTARDRAEADLRGFPVGSAVPAWYDPDRPGRVVVTRGVGYPLGALLLVIGSLVPLLMVGVPVLLLALAARRHWLHLEQTTGRVVGGEVREIPAGEAPAFRPVLLVEYDRGSAPWRGTIPGGEHIDRAAAEAELRAMLSAHPVGEQRPLWYDPRDRYDPTFEHLTPAKFVGGATLLVLWPGLAVAGGLLQFGRWAWWFLTVGGIRTARRAWWALTDPRPGPAPEVPPGRRAVLILAAVVTLVLTVRFVFRQDYEVYFTFEPVMGKVVSTEVVPDPEGGFDPRVRYGYVAHDQYFERWTHRGWYGSGWYGPILRPLTRDEAEAMVAPYRPGAAVLVWYDPTRPLGGYIRRYARWHLYPVLIPPLWVLVVQTRRLLRRQ